MDYGAAIRKKRNALDVSQEELAAEMGWNGSSTVSMKERGCRGVTRVEYFDCIAACERIYARRLSESDPADVLAE